jgi:hypothetical protein
VWFCLHRYCRLPQYALVSLTLPCPDPQPAGYLIV